MLDKKATPLKPSIWPEERIREELRRLDKKTGLHGADLRIHFGTGYRALGYFHARLDGTDFFTFAMRYFEDPKWPEQSALDVIRHEYAHYMEWELYGGVSHGSRWKACCEIVGAMPTRYYYEDQSEYYKQKNGCTAHQNMLFGTYEVGKSIIHPQFGKGMIVEARGEGTSRILSVKFPEAGLKRLGAAWVDKNCKRA